VVHLDKRFSEAFLFLPSPVHSPPFTQKRKSEQIKHKEVNNLKQKINSESPVMGVILIVAITVVLSTIIATFIFSTVGNINQNYLITASANQVTADRIDITYQGGPDHDALDWLNVSVAGNKHHVDYPSVGYSWTSTGTPSKDHVVVAAHFVDGTEQVILDTYV